jgi:hypothetical protein
MVTSAQISECQKLNKDILNKQDTAISGLVFKMENITNQISVLKADFNKKNCDKVLIEAKLGYVTDVTSKYSELDKIRIETDSYKQRNYRLILGVVILVSGLLIVATISKD